MVNGKLGDSECDYKDKASMTVLTATKMQGMRCFSRVRDR